MAYHLRRVTDSEGFSGAVSDSISWNKDRTFNKIDGIFPKVGNSMKVGSLTAGTYSRRDWWMTTIVTEILEEIKNEYVHYIKFKTENSIYEWWNGKYPK